MKKDIYQRVTDSIVAERLAASITHFHNNKNQGEKKMATMTEGTYEICRTLTLSTAHITHAVTQFIENEDICLLFLG